MQQEAVKDKKNDDYAGADIKYHFGDNWDNDDNAHFFVAIFGDVADDTVLYRWRLFALLKIVILIVIIYTYIYIYIYIIILSFSYNQLEKTRST